MGAKDVLRRAKRAVGIVRWALPAALFVAAVLPDFASADREEPGATGGARDRLTPSLIRPRRVTIGSHNHFMGVLGPRSRYLYYVTDEYDAYDLFVQSPINSNGEALFEAFGDVTWPAISANGKELAYIRYETDSRGDACRRRIRGNGKVRNDREECHATEDADLQIYWRNDGRLGVLTREELHGDHVLLDGVFQRDPERKEANVIGLAISPDERWVAYVPIARLRDTIGVSFSNRASSEGMLVRRAIPGAEEFGYKPDLPGISGYPVFSPDGQHLYFSQFPNDTNRDGVIDAEDNGVLFRVPFDGEGEEPRFGQPLQLTNAEWNCHYPSVREKAMAVTCAIGAHLHIYLLPPSGTVPVDWDQSRIAAESDSVHDRWSELLLRQHLLVGAPDAKARAVQLKALTKLHLDLREFEAAIYYGEQRVALFETLGESDWWSKTMILLAKHRRADRALTRGRFSEAYIEDSQDLVAEVKAVPGDGSPDAEALRALVLSRIVSDLGDKATAVALADQVEVALLQDEAVLDFAFQQFDHLYGLLADYDRRLARLEEVALHDGSSVTQALRHSKGFLVLLQRGRPEDERLGRLETAREKVPDGTRLAAALDVEIALYQLTEDNAKQVESELVRLYQATDNVHVRRYLIVSALRASNRQGVESLQQSLVELWIQAAEDDETQQKTSTALYRLVVLERAYGAFAEGDLATAARYFDKARQAADSLAGHVGWIETQLRLGAPDLAKQNPSDSQSTRDFVEAYLMTRDLGAIERNQELDKRVERARELLEATIEADPHEPLPHLLLAYALHHRGVRRGEREDVATAVRHYLLALDLGQRRPRVLAPAHAGMALAQASLGNHRRALEDYEDRFELPMVSPEEEIGLLLNYARSLFHVNESKEAIDAITKALTRMHATAEGPEGAVDEAARALTRYEPLALDRLALYQLDAGRTQQALSTHSELQRSIEAHPEAAASINDVKADARLATAFLMTEDPDQALGSVTDGKRHLKEADPLRPDDIDRRIRPVTYEFVYDEDHLQVLLAGLEASASRELEDLDRAMEALIARKEALDQRYDTERADEDLLELALTCLRLAEIVLRQGDLTQTKLYLEDGLVYTEQHAVLTGSDVSEVGFHLIRAYAELHFNGRVDLATYQRDLEAELLRYYLFLSEVRNPDWEIERKRFEIFLARLRLENPVPTNASLASADEED
ncbi:MAG: hypothetical protein AAF500_01455 [Myxococcota bacterium]